MFGKEDMGVGAGLVPCLTIPSPIIYYIHIGCDIKFGVVISKSIIDQWEIRLNELPIAGMNWEMESRSLWDAIREHHEIGEEMGTIWKHPIII